MTSVGIVTGAGRGMGAACAVQLANQVDVLLLVDLHEELMAETAKALAEHDHPVRTELFSLDVSDAVGIAPLATRVSDASGTFLRATIKWLPAMRPRRLLSRH